MYYQHTFSEHSTPGKNAHLWIYLSTIHNWVKITLRPGQSFQESYGGSTEEGYSNTEEIYIHQGDRIERNQSTNASDCDGPIDFYTTYECPLDQLTAHYRDPIDQNDHAPQNVPEWRRISASQRDHYAEQMGY